MKVCTDLHCDQAAQEWIDSLQDAQIISNKYTSPHAIRRKNRKDKAIFDVEKSTYHQFNSEWAWMIFLFVQLFNESITDNLWLGIPLIGSMVFAFFASFKSTRQIEFDLQEKVMLVKYKNYLNFQSIKKIKLEKLQATLSKNGSVLKLYKKIYGGRKEVAIIKLDKEGRNEKLIRIIKEGLEKLNIHVTEPGIMPV